MDETMVRVVGEKYRSLSGILDERSRRIWAAIEARALPRGGVSLVAEATGLSRTTIHAGISELEQRSATPPLSGRVRRCGGGRKALTEHSPELLVVLDLLVEPTSRGDPESPLRWTCKSTRRLAHEMRQYGYHISERAVAGLLHGMKYSLQANAKTIEGTQHPDRNAQFEYINAQTKEFMCKGQPAVSVDTKKKELVGEFKNGGRGWQPYGTPEETLVHDFKDKQLGKVIPYGVYDVAANNEWVSVGIDHDTSDFAADSILAWWRQMGGGAYPDAEKLLIMADAGGSNAARSRLWKVAVQRLADTTGLRIHVCHFPPGTSKWNKIEHRMFSFITQNRRGRPLISHEAIINLIGSTTTQKGLNIKAKLNKKKYPTGIKVTDKQIAEVNIVRHDSHGDWNYTIAPNE